MRCGGISCNPSGQPRDSLRLSRLARKTPTSLTIHHTLTHTPTYHEMPRCIRTYTTARTRCRHTRYLYMCVLYVCEKRAAFHNSVKTARDKLLSTSHVPRHAPPLLRSVCECMSYHAVGIVAQCTWQSYACLHIHTLSARLCTCAHLPHILRPNARRRSRPVCQCACERMCLCKEKAAAATSTPTPTTTFI